MPRGKKSAQRTAAEVEQSKPRRGRPPKSATRTLAQRILAELKNQNVSAEQLAEHVGARKFTGEHLLKLFSDFVGNKSNLKFRAARGRYAGKVRDLTEKEIPVHFAMSIARQVHAGSESLSDRLGFELGEKLGRPLRF